MMETINTGGKKGAVVEPSLKWLNEMSGEKNKLLLLSMEVRKTAHR